MSYQITNEFRLGPEIIQPASTTKEINVPGSAFAKLSKSQSAADQNIYNPVLDSDEVVTTSIAHPEVKAQAVIPEAIDVNQKFSPEIDVFSLLSGKSSQEEPAIPVAQSIEPQTTVVGEPAYGEIAQAKINEPIGTVQASNNVIQFPNVREESAHQESAQSLDELEDTISRIEESISITKTLLDQAKLALEKAKGIAQEDYQQEDYQKAA